MRKKEMSLQSKYEKLRRKGFRKAPISVERVKPGPKKSNNGLRPCDYVDRKYMYKEAPRISIASLRAKMPNVGDILKMCPSIYIGQGETYKGYTRDCKVIYTNPDNLTYLVEFPGSFREMHSMKEMKAVLTYA